MTAPIDILHALLKDQDFIDQTAKTAHYTGMAFMNALNLTPPWVYDGSPPMREIFHIMVTAVMRWMEPKVYYNQGIPVDVMARQSHVQFWDQLLNAGWEWGPETNLVKKIFSLTQNWQHLDPFERSRLTVMYTTIFSLVFQQISKRDTK